MHCVIFDIDGTLIHSHAKEGDCFEQALNKVTGINNVEQDWRCYKHVTDVGIVNECIEKHLERAGTPAEFEAIEEHFFTSFNRTVDEFPITPLMGVHTLFEELNKHSNIALAIATGSHYRSAIFKLHKAGIDTQRIPIATSQDSHDRIEIMQCALEKAKKFHQVSDFSSITYVGDGPWDVAAVNALKWNFIGIATNYSEKQLREWGASFIIKDYCAAEHFITHLLS